MDEVIYAGEIPNFYTLMEECLERLRCKNYSKFTLQKYTWTLRHLQRYMDEQGVLKYTPDIGYNFINSLKSRLSERTVQDKAKAIHYLDRYCSEVYPQSSKTTISTLPEEFQTAIKDYLILCQSKGNIETTITKKRRACNAFINLLVSFGCDSFSKITIDTIQKAVMLIGIASMQEQIKLFLFYLFSCGKLPHDYSILIPHITLSKPIPSVYSLEEIDIVEKTIDRSRPNGKRDYAVFVLISRYGLRPSDVANLRFQNIDFQTKRIMINQVKTKEFLSLPLLEIVELALEDYIVQIRKKESISDFIFLTASAPYRPLSRAEISTIIKFAIKKSGIEIKGRRTGPCALRASLASSMVNDGHPYEAVRKILGHKDPNVIKRYARLDVEILRRYALNPVPPKGNFAEFLKKGFRK